MLCAQNISMLYSFISMCAAVNNSTLYIGRILYIALYDISDIFTVQIMRIFWCDILE